MKFKLIAIIFFFGLTSCEVSPVDTDDPNYVFDGRGGIKCKANGELLLPKVSLNGTGAEMNLDFISWDNEDFMSMYFRDGGGSPDFISQSIKIRINDVLPELINVGDIYILANEADSDFGQYRINSIEYNYSTNDQQTGELEILFHDLENRILGGTFEFDAVDENGTIVEIREGEFDMSY